jgi:hypothetical protein
MRWHIRSKRLRASLAAVLLLFSQLSLAGQLCLTTAVGLGIEGMGEASSPPPPQSHVAVIETDGNCCTVTVEPAICVVQQDIMTVGVPASTLSASFVAASHPIECLVDLRERAHVAAASEFPEHPPLSILFCRYLN